MTKHGFDSMVGRGATCLLVIAVLALGAAHAQNAHHDRAIHRGDEIKASRVEGTLAPDLAALYAAVDAFADVEAATAAGYGPSSACMAGDLGAQGIHYGKDALFEPSVVLETPQLLMYEPRADGSLRFIGVEYLVFQQAWHDAGHVERPTLLGRTFGLNETLLDEPFYLLHVWIGQFNPSGLFADWNPLVECGDAIADAH